MTRGIVATGIVTLALVTGCGSGKSREVVVTPPPRAMQREPASIVVERTHVPKGHAYGWWKQHGYSEVTLYSDGTRYYSREGAPKGLRAVTVYQREGKYYLPDEDGEQGHTRHGHGGDRKN